MTTEQAAQLIEQQQQLLDLYRTMQPLFVALVRDVFPVIAVGAALWLGVTLGKVST